MEELPPPLIVDILSRLPDSAELARCRLVSKTFNALSYEVQSIRLFCTLPRYLGSRALETKPLFTPFKTILKNLVRGSRALKYVAIGVDKSLGSVSYDDVEDESDDLYLTDLRFAKEWLPSIGEQLRSLSVSDFWVQSCWRKSEVLPLISSFCHSLLELELKNAWLSVDGLNPMPTLTSLKLEFIRLDDEDLNKVNSCFPCLKVLNLKGVGGLKEPKIHLLHLKTCHWTISNAPLALAIFAPNLVNLTLKCVKPRSLVLETPSLSDFHLTIQEANGFKVKEFPYLKNLLLHSEYLSSTICMFPCSRAIKKLTVDSANQNAAGFSLETVFDIFPNLRYLNLGFGAWMQAEGCFAKNGLEDRIGMKGLKEIVAHMSAIIEDATVPFIFSVLDKCTNLSNVAIVIHPSVGFLTASNLVSTCRAVCPRVAWRWGMWKEGGREIWVE